MKYVLFQKFHWHRNTCLWVVVSVKGICLENLKKLILDCQMSYLADLTPFTILASALFEHALSLETEIWIYEWKYWLSYIIFHKRLKRNDIIFLNFIQRMDNRLFFVQFTWYYKCSFFQNILQRIANYISHAFILCGGFMSTS